MPPTLPIEELLRHNAWIQALARRLVDDPEHAADLAQDTCVTALASPPRSAGNLRGWLRTVMKSLLRRDLRSAERRRTREQAVARREAQAGELDVVERAATHRRLVVALMDLEEPFRSTLLQRYFDDLGPREIAERQGLPLDTVRSRLRRGLARLRERLDREAGGTSARESWMPAVAALAGSFEGGALSAPATPATIGALAMDLKLKIAAVCAIVVAGALVVPALLESAGSSPAARAPADEPVVLAPVQEAPQALEAGDARAVVETATRTGVESAPVEPPDSPVRPVPALVRGEVLDAAGRPVPGFDLAIVLPGAAQESATPTLESGADGTFELEMPARRSEIRAAQPGWSTVLAGALVPGSTLEPLILVAPAIDLGGRVVDEYGLGLAGATVVLRPPEDFLRRLSRVLDASVEMGFETRSAADGSFELPAAPSLRGSLLSARLEGYDEALVEAPTQADRGLTLQLSRPRDGGAELRGVVLDPAGAPVAGARVCAASRVLRSDEHGRFTFDAPTAAAAERVVALHPGHLPGEARALEGEDGPSWPDTVRLVLGGPPLELAGVVVDEDGRPLPRVRVWLDDPTLFGREGRMPVHVEALVAAVPTKDELEAAGESVWDSPTAFWSWVTTDERGRFRLGGLGARAYRLKVMDPVTAVHAIEGPYQAGGADAESLRLVLPTRSASRRVAGLVVDEYGMPVPAAEVEILHRAFSVTTEEGRSTSWDAGGATVRTDENGSFEVERAPRSGFWISVSAEGERHTSHRPGEDEDLERLRIVLKRASRPVHVQVDLAGRWPTADGVSFLDPEGRPIPATVRRNVGERTSRLRTELVDGRSHVLIVQEGHWQMVVHAGEVELAREWITLAPTDEVTILR